MRGTGAGLQVDSSHWKLKAQSPQGSRKRRARTESQAHRCSYPGPGKVAGTLPTTTTLLTPVILNRVTVTCSELIFTRDICHHPSVHPNALGPSILLSYSHTNPHLQSCIHPTQSNCGGVLPLRSGRLGGSLACEGWGKIWIPSSSTCTSWEVSSLSGLQVEMERMPEMSTFLPYRPLSHVGTRP